MTAAVMLEVHSLPLSRGKRTLAKAITFAVPGGSYLELQGPNGSGKTSLLRALAYPPALLDPHVRRLDAADVFYFGQSSGFRPELGVGAQLALSLALYGAPADARRDRSLLERFGLARHLAHRIRQLSQGQVRRLMLAVMAASGRTLWLIDEPLNALDGDAIALFESVLAEHVSRGGAAVIATHRPIHLALPGLAVYCSGILCLGSSSPQLQPAPVQGSRTSLPPPQSARIERDGWHPLLWVLRRERLLALARPQDLAWPSVFHWMVVTLFPFGLGSDPELLERAAGGVFWISALLAVLIGATRFFEADFEHGALNDCQTAGLSLTWLVTGKILAGGLLIGLPLALSSMPLALLFGVPNHLLPILGGSLWLGVMSLVAGSCLFAALGLMARQAQVVICLLAIPVFVPVLIFGTAVLNGDITGPLLTLSSLALLSLVTVPIVTAKVLALALE
jgi:heme exporter protein B